MVTLSTKFSSKTQLCPFANSEFRIPNLIRAPIRHNDVEAALDCRLGQGDLRLLVHDFHGIDGAAVGIELDTARSGGALETVASRVFIYSEEGLPLLASVGVVEHHATLVGAAAGDVLTGHGEFSRPVRRKGQIPTIGVVIVGGGHVHIAAVGEVLLPVDGIKHVVGATVKAGQWVGVRNLQNVVVVDILTAGDGIAEGSVAVQCLVIEGDIVEDALLHHEHIGNLRGCAAALVHHGAGNVDHGGGVGQLAGANLLDGGDAGGEICGAGDFQPLAGAVIVVGDGNGVVTGLHVYQQQLLLPIPVQIESGIAGVAGGRDKLHRLPVSEGIGGEGINGVGGVGHLPRDHQLIGGVAAVHQLRQQNGVDLGAVPLQNAGGLILSLFVLAEDIDFERCLICRGVTEKGHCFGHVVSVQIGQADGLGITAGDGGCIFQTAVEDALQDGLELVELLTGLWNGIKLLGGAEEDARAAASRGHEEHQRAEQCGNDCFHRSFH